MPARESKYVRSRTAMIQPSSATHPEVVVAECRPGASGAIRQGISSSAATVASTCSGIVTMLVPNRTYCAR